MRTKSTVFSAATIAALTMATGADGHSINQSIGGYQGNDGLQRRRVGLGLNADAQGQGQLSAMTFGMNASEDRLEWDQSRLEEPLDAEQRHNIDVVAGQTWNKITETRVLGSYSRTENSQNRTVGVGVSQWFHSETFRYSIDLSRTLIEQEPFEVLDYDSQVLTPAPKGESVGLNVGLRHLATPTTILDYGITHISQAGRPASYAGSFGVRQYLQETDGAVHLNGTRAINRGELGTQTTYGEVDSWIAETAYLQNMWSGARARIAYRYYKENETTRAFADQLQLGTDAVSLGFSQEINDRDIVPTPLTFEASGSRLRTNEDLMATTFETGLTAKF